jgi:hypothetical protein
MADDIKAENFKKSVEKLTDVWSKQVAPLAKQLAAVNDDLGPLEKVKEPGPDEKKRIAELRKKRDGLREQIDEATLAFNTSLRALDDPVTADEKEVVKLPAWIKEVIKRKGIALGKQVTLVPDASFDVKKKRLKSGGITLKWDF